jgi:hypothetical protein
MLGSVKQIRAYLQEVIDVKKAEERMKVIDAEVEKMTPEQKSARQNRIAAQRNHFFSTLYSVLYDEPVEKEEDSQSVERTASIQKAFNRFLQGEENKEFTELY